MIQPCVDLALGRAFTPDPLDVSVPLARRFAKRPLVAVTIYKDGMEAVPVTFEGDAPRFGQPEFCATGGEDVDAAFLRAFAERHKAGECLLNLTSGYTAILSSRARRPETDEEAILLMRDNPERLLGEPPAQGCRHSIAFHPTHNFAIVFAHKENDIGSAVGLAAKADLGIARLHCGMASLLIHILGNFWSEVGKESDLLFVGRSSIFFVTATESGFGRPLFDIGLKEAALKQALGERIGKLKPEGRVILVNDSECDVGGLIRERMGSVTVIEPLKGRAQPTLTACCSDQPRLAYELFPTERTVRPFAPSRLRFVPFVFWGAIAASAAVVGTDELRNTLAAQAIANLKAQQTLVDETQQRAAATIRDAQSRERTAEAMAEWLQISPPTQSLLVAISHEIGDAADQGQKENKPVAYVDSLSLTRQEGQPQMRLSFVVLGESAAANRVFQRLAALFGRLGYSTVDIKQMLVPGGFRYEHLLNVPKAVVP